MGVNLREKQLKIGQIFLLFSYLLQYKPVNFLGIQIRKTATILIKPFKQIKANFSG